MAAHGRIGSSYDQYLIRKNRPHKVSGVYEDEGGKRIVMTREQRLVALHRNATGKRERDYPLYRQFTCKGRRGKLAQRFEVRP